jgi:hypothetical protein
LNTFTRKTAYKLFLFGSQAIGGVEKSIDDWKPDYDMHKRGITHLFMDSAGTYHSNEQTCILTGVFFFEPDRVNASKEDLIEVICKICDATGSLN